MTCADCRRAERETWPVYDVTRWCCRARHIVDCSTSSSVPRETLDQVRRRLCAAEKRRHPADWSAVRDRVRMLAGVAS